MCERPLSALWSGKAAVSVLRPAPPFWPSDSTVVVATLKPPCRSWASAPSSKVSGDDRTSRSSPGLSFTLNWITPAASARGSLPTVSRTPFGESTRRVAERSRRCRTSGV